MPAVDRRGIEYVCALAVALAFPLALRYPPLAVISVLGMTGVYYLWFSRQHWLLALSVMLALIGTVMWRGIPAGGLLVVGLLIPSLALAHLRRRGVGTSAAVTLAAIVPVAAILAKYDYFLQMLDIMAIDLRQRAVAMQTPGFYSVEQQRMLLDTMNRLADKLPYFFPAALLFLIVAVLSGSALIGNSLVRASGIFARPVPEFSLWKIPEWLMIPLGMAVILVLTNETVLVIIGWNTLLFLAILYSICGLSLVEYALRSRRFPGSVKVAVYLFLFLTQLVAGILLPLVALFDSKFDFRKIRAKQLG
jgi:uncharacterized protein YybS (DUF2232 family)